MEENPQWGQIHTRVQVTHSARDVNRDAEGLGEQSSEAAAPCMQQKEAGDDWRSLLRNQNQHRLTARGPLREGIQGWQPENATEGMVHGAEPQEIRTRETLPFLDQPYPTNPEQWDSEQLTSESKCKARAQAARGSQAKAEQCPYFP